MKTIQGPGLFLAQFLRDVKPYNNIESLSKWASSPGFKGAQVPTWDSRVIDLYTSSRFKNYCDDDKGKLRESGVEIIELASYLKGQILAIRPRYELLFPGLPILERECSLKSSEQVAMEGASFVARHIIDVAQTTFGDAGVSSHKMNEAVPGLN